MKQYSHLFQRYYLGDESTDIKLNRFLEEHPNYRVDKVSFEQPKGTCLEHLFVVFNVEEETDRANKTEATHCSDKFMDTVEYLKQGKLPPLNTDNDEGLHTHKYGWT